MVPSMTNRPARTGRPSKGDRVVIYSRAPREVAERIEREAAEAGLPMSDVVANILAAHFDLPRVARGADPKYKQQELEFKQAS